MKRKNILIVALALVMCLALLATTACKPKVDPTAQSLTIANSTDLMAKWNVGEADRTVEVTVTEGLQNKDVVLTAEPEGVVSIDGMKLHAEKAGTVTITATAVLDDDHSYTDTVEIKVTYNYTLQITNKSDLTKAFRIGEADKEVTVKLSDDIKDNPVTITSSKTDVVSVVGNKIHAVSKGEATITATSTLNGVKFSDSFKVTVWGEFDLVVNNKTALEQPIGKYAKPVAIDYELREAGDYTDKDVTITSSNTEVAKIENGAIVPVTVGKTVVTVACGDKTVTINVSIEVLAELQIAEHDENATYYTGNEAGEGCVLPEVTLAMNSAEQDVKADVEILAGDGLTLSTDKTKVYANEIGKYTVTYRFDDVDGKPTKELTITISFVDELFAATGAHVDNNLPADSALGDAGLKAALAGEAGAYSQVTTSTSDALLFGKLNISASKLYYAEATFAVNNTTSNASLALAHFSSVNERYALLSKLASNSGDFLNIDVTFNKNDNVSKGQAIVANKPANGQTSMFQYKLFNSRRISRLDGDTGVATETTLVTIAVARDGDYFYTFVNGQYVNCVTPANLRNVDTVPAIVGKELNTAQVEISGVQYLSNAGDVQTKLDELLGVNKEKMIVPYVDTNDGVSTNTYAESFSDNIKLESNIENSGLAFTFTNGVNGIVANDLNGSAFGPYIYFDGNFTFSWEYMMTDVMEIADENTADRYRSIFELKDYTVNYDIVQLGLGSVNNKIASYNGNSRFEMNVKGYINKDGWKQWCEPATNDAGVGLNTIKENTKVRFSLTRILKTDHAEYILTATVLNEDGTATDKTYTRIVSWGDANVQEDKYPATNQGYTTTQSNWAQPVLAYWRNSGVSGVFTNVQWQLLPNDVDVSVIAETTEATDVTLTKTPTTYEVDGEQKPTTLNKFSVTFDKLVKGATFNLGEALDAGDYLVKVIAIGDMAVGSNAHDLRQATVYQNTFTTDEEMQYLQLDGVVLGHGKYEVQLTRIPEPDPVKIMNKDDLVAYWKLGDDDRTMEIKFGKDVDETTLNIASSDPETVSVEGKVLHALKVGKATITVTVGTGDDVYTDTVDVIVHYDYSLTIDNKDELTALYRVDDDDRTIDATFTDGVDGATIVITSSDDTVLAIVDGKLHAVAKGVVTITATVTIDEDNVFTDKVTVTVLGRLDITVTNRDELEDPIGISDEPHAIVIELVEAGDYTLSDVTVTSDNEAVVTITEDGKLQPVGAGDATITITCGSKSVTINVTVVNAILEIATDEVTHYINEEFDIPAIVTATDDQGVDKTESVVVTATDGLTLTDSTVNAKATATAFGVYTITYSLQIGDASPVTRTVTVAIVEDLFDETGAHVADNQADGSDLGNAMITSTIRKESDNSFTQLTMFGNDNLAFAKLAGGQASTIYYAEATFEIVTVSPDNNDVNVALGHFLTGNNDRHALLSVLNVNSSDYVGLDVTFNKVGNVKKDSADANGQEYVFGYKIFKTRNFNKNQQQTQLVTIAVARDGDYFYTFIDGHYLNCTTFKDFRSENTLPAIVGNNLKSGDVKVSNIVYLSDANDVREKLYTADGLLGVNKEKMLTPFVNYYDGGDATSTNYGNAFNGKTTIDTNVEGAEDRGLYYDYTNTGNGRYDASVSPYVYLDGNFTFQWELEMTNIVTASETTDKYRSVLEVKDASLPSDNSSFSCIQLGTALDTVTATKKQQLEFNTKAFKKTNSDYLEWVEPFKDTIPRGTKIRFTVTRLLKEDHAEYIMTAVLLDGTNATYTRIVNWGNVADAYMKNAQTIAAQKNWAKAVIPYWCNSGFSGKFSNIKWQLLPDDATTAEFVEESADVIAVSEGNFSCNSLMSKDVVLDLGESSALEAGEYVVTIKINRNLPIAVTSDPNSADVYTTKVTVDNDARYLKLSNIYLYDGSYTITFTKVETSETPVTPDPDTPVTE